MYEYADKRLKAILQSQRELFNRFNRGAKFDNLNDLSNRTKVLYKNIETIVEREFVKIAKKQYEETYPEGDSSFITTAWIVSNVLKEYNGVTKYVYTRESDRKRARFYEMLVSTTNGKEIDRNIKSEINSIIKKSNQLMELMNKQYAIIVVDKANIKALKDRGFSYGKWQSEDDNKTCNECYSMNNNVYPISDIPSKPHYGCRCWIVGCDKYGN